MKKRPVEIYLTNGLLCYSEPAADCSNKISLETLSYFCMIDFQQKLLGECTAERPCAFSPGSSSVSRLCQPTFGQELCSGKNKVGYSHVSHYIAIFRGGVEYPAIRRAHDRETSWSCRRFGLRGLPCL